MKYFTRNCWVIDPQEPNKCHMYRRIHLSQSISVTITINPLHPTAFPLEIRFLGSDNEVKRQMADISNNIHVRSMYNMSYNDDSLTLLFVIKKLIHLFTELE